MVFGLRANKTIMFVITAQIRNNNPTANKLLNYLRKTLSLIMGKLQSVVIELSVFHV